MAAKQPSLPSNYVSLAVLKGRWLEQQRKQSEEEELRRKREEEELRRKHEEELRRKHEEDQKKKIQNQNGNKSLQKSQSSSRHASWRNNQIPRMRDGQTSVASKPTLKESRSEASGSVSKVEQVEDKLNKKAREKKDTRRKPRAEKTLTVPLSRSPPVEKIQVDTKERNDKIEDAGCEFPHNSVDQAANDNVWKPRVRMSKPGKYCRKFSRGGFSSRLPPVEKLQADNSVDQAANHNVWKPRVKISTAGKTNHQYSREFSKGAFSSRSPPVEKLQADTTERNYKIEEAGCEYPHSSVDQAAKPRVRMSTAGKTNYQYNRYSQRRNFHQKQTDCKQVWVEKGETTANRSSGISVNAGRASSSNSGRDTDGTTSIW